MTLPTGRYDPSLRKLDGPTAAQFLKVKLGQGQGQSRKEPSYEVPSWDSGRHLFSSKSALELLHRLFGELRKPWSRHECGGLGRQSLNGAIFEKPPQGGLNGIWMHTETASQSQNGEPRQPFTVDPAREEFGPGIALDIGQTVQGRTVAPPPPPEVGVEDSTAGEGVDR